MRRDVGEPELICAEPKRRAHGWVELPHRTLAKRPDRVVERPHALHRSERKALRKSAVARVELRCSRTQDAIRIRVVLEDAQDDLVRGLSCRHRMPRMNSSYVMRRLPSGCTSSGSSLPPATRAL